MLKIGLIIGTTRGNRFADKPAAWLIAGAAARNDFRLEILDLREVRLPFLDEPIPPALLRGQFLSPEANSWRQQVGAYDGYIAVVGEYNHGAPAVLKNALDSAFLEWQRKPISFVGYGKVGGARAIEQLRNVAVELQMAPVRHEVNIGFEAFMSVQNDERTLDSYHSLVKARSELFDHLVWWASALKAARQKLRVVA